MKRIRLKNRSGIDIFIKIPFRFGKMLSLLVFVSVLFISCSKDSNGGEQSVQKESYSEDIKIQVVSAIGPDAQSGSALSNAYDGSKETIYHSSWGGTTLPQSLVFTLKSDAAKLDYIYLSPRSDGAGNGVILAGEVWVSTRDNDTFVKVTQFNFTSRNAIGAITLPSSVANPAKVKIVVTKTDGNGEGEKNKYVSLAEIECWQTNPNKANFLNLFTDGSCTEVKPGITRDAVAAIADTVLRNIGLSVFDKKVDARRIVECQSYPDPYQSAQKNKTSRYGYVDNVTGIYLSPSVDAYIFVGGTPVAPITARVIDHNSNGITYKDYPLKSGLNKFRPSASGLVYLIYQSEQDSKIKVFFARGFVNGYFDLKTSNPNDWFKMINGTASSYFDLKGDYTVITFTTESLKGINNADIVGYIKAWDQIVYKEQEFMGLVKYNRMQKTRMYVKAVPDPSAYMYATDYFTAYQLGTLSALNTADKLKTSGIWGPAHEIGHSNQIRPDFKWPGMTEVSNNVCSLYMQTLFGGLSASRIQSEDLGGGLTRYQKAFDSFFKNDSHNHFLDGDVFCKLVPFWQLQLYFAHVNGYTDFYKDLLEVLRNQKSPDINHCHLEFYKKCCDIAQTDLTEFFAQWGLLIPFSATINDYATYNVSVSQASVDEAIAYVKAKGYPKPAMPIQYIQDNTVNLYTSSAKFVKGTVAVSGSSVQLSGCKNAVAYVVKATNGATTKVYAPKENGGTYSFETGTSSLGSIEAIDATGISTRIY